jgi:hypothetical protein
MAIKQGGFNPVGIQIRTFRAPSWIVPLLILAALAILPFVFALALGLFALALAATVVRRLILPPSSRRDSPVFPGQTRRESGNSNIIDVEYEAKDDHEKD